MSAPHTTTHGNLPRAAESWSPAAGRRFALRIQAELDPILTEQLDGMLRTIGTVAAAQIVRRAIVIAAPADPLGMLRVQRKFLGHAVES